jgi:hypothetical protein
MVKEILSDPLARGEAKVQGLSFVVLSVSGINENFRSAANGLLKGFTDF